MAFLDTTFRAPTLPDVSISGSTSSVRVGVATGLLVLLFVLVRLWDITAYSLWLDEILAVQAARMSTPDLIRYAISEISHPPLFYLLAKVWITVGGESLLWLKLLPLTAAILSIVPFYLLCRELKTGAAEMNFALFLMSVNTYLASYSQEFRMYSLSMLFSVTSVWLFVRFLNTRRTPYALLIVNLLLIYTHYYGGLLVGTEFLFLVLFERGLVIRFVLSQAPLAVLFGPWAYLVISTAVRGGGVQNIGWIRQPGVDEFVYYYGLLSGLTPFRVATLFGLFLFAAAIGWRMLKPSRDVKFLVLVSTLPALISFVVSQKFPVWDPRYLIISAVPFLLLASLSVFSLPTIARRVTISLIILTATSAGIYGIVSRDKIDWRKVAAHINASDPTPATIAAFGGEHTAGPLRYYLDNRFKVERATELPDLDRYWFVYRESVGGGTPRFEVEAHARGYTVGDVFADGRLGHQVHLFYVFR